LLLHFAVEEGIFYPAAREAIQDERLMNEAADEHESAKSIIIMLGNIAPDDPMFDTKVRSLADQIEHHVQDEESVMFPKVLVSDLDLVAVGRELLGAKNDMRARLGMPIEEIADEHFPEEDMFMSSSHARNVSSRMRHI
jgi:iron-sulfur cluster repair protein YtfE (RIC family)